MTLRPCLDCGTPTAGPRCTEHQLPDRHHRPNKPSAKSRGYDHTWTKLSKRARRLQPFCTDCGATDDLQADHLPQAWERKAAGLPIRLTDIQVLCGPCNRAAGAARGNAPTRGDAPNAFSPTHAAQANSPLHTGGAL